MATEVEVLPREVIEALKGLFTFCVDHPADSPHMRAKVAQFCQTVLKSEPKLLEVSQTDLTSTLLGKFQDTWDALIPRLPYLSKEQRDALAKDMRRLFNEWGSVFLDTPSKVESAGKNIQQSVEGWASFGLDSMPVDVVSEESLELFVRDLLEGVFSGLLNNLSLAERTRKELLIQQKIEAFLPG
ncbi:MAG TPA: hypothetical protein VGA53_03785 [Candidatus Paceibacterota bacterium]